MNNSDCYDNDEVSDEYLHEQIQIAKDFNVDISKVKLVDHLASGDICVYVDGLWRGYLETNPLDNMSPEEERENWDWWVSEKEDS